MDDVQLRYEPFPNDAQRRFISDHIVGYNFAATGISGWHPVGFFLARPEAHRFAGEPLGGLTGHVWGSWLHVQFLWIADALRGQRHGTRLMDAAEQFAIERGATAATLETHSFSAPDFYRKRGYVEFGRLDDYPAGHAKLFMRKSLVAAP